MRKMIIILSIAAICVLTALGILEADRRTAHDLGISDMSTVFNTIFNEEFRLK